MKKLSMVLLLLLAFSTIQAQIPNTRFKDGIKLYLSKDSVSWLKATGCLQTWARYTSNNPGTTVNGYAQKGMTDIGIRRFRLQLFGNITSRVFFYSQFGLNNYNYLSSRSKSATGANNNAFPFFHDLVTEYSVVPKHFSLGMGLTGWSGLSRYASPSVATTLMYDAPLFQQATNDVTDQFLRKLGIYAKGKLGKFDYRVALSKPNSISASASKIDTTWSTTATFAPEKNLMQAQGYFQWQFLDQESNLTPYTQGTYLGTKRVFNIGSGFIYQPQAMRVKETSSSTTKTYQDMKLFAVDAFLDYAIDKEKQTAITFYAGYFNYDFGTNYMRALGVMNNSTGSNNALLNKLSGFGNAAPMYGTGNAIYAQGGYLFKKDLFGSKGTLQPNADILVANYKALKTPMIMWNVGMNYLLNGHNAKLSLNYQSRPIFTYDAQQNIGVEIKSARRGMVVCQYQIFF